MHMLTNPVYLTVVLGMSIGVVAFTVARTKVAASFREFAKAKSTWLGSLFGCPYCLSHWLSFGATVIYRPRLLHLFFPLDLLVTSLVMVAISTFTFGIITRAVSPGASSAGK